MSQGNRYVVEESGPGRVLAGDSVQFGADQDDGFDPYLVEHVWCGEAGFAVLVDGVIRWSDGQTSETTYAPYKPEEIIKIQWLDGWVTLRLDGRARVPIVYEQVRTATVEHDRALRIVTLTMGNLRLTTSPEGADDLATKLDFHAERARGR